MSSEIIQNEISGLVDKLRDMQIALQYANVMTFTHEGYDITELVKNVKTEEDLMDLAMRLRDGLIPGTEPFDEMYMVDADPTLLADDLEEMREERREQESDDNDEDEDEPEWPEVFDFEMALSQQIDDLGLSGHWSSLKSFLGEVGYPETTDDYPFDRSILSEVMYEVFSDDMESLEKFLSGEMDQQSEKFLEATSMLLEWAGDSREEYKYSDNAFYTGLPVEAMEQTFFEEEAQAELESEHAGLCGLCRETIEEIETIAPESLPPTLHDDVDDLDVDELHELYDDLEEKLEALEEERDKDKSAEKKRQREWFDEQEVREQYKQAQPRYDLQEIRFEQQQTDLVIHKKSFENLTREIMQDFIELNDYNVDPEAFEALQTAAEAMLTQMFGEAVAETVNAQRTLTTIRDMQHTTTVKKIMGHE